MARGLDQAKRIMILKAARRILLRDGYADAKMADIAKEAGVAPGTLYLYFESKESLASAIAEDSFNRFSSQFIGLVKKLGTPEGVAALLDWAFRIAVEEEDVLAMSKQSKPDAQSHQGRLKFVEQSAEALEELMSQGLIRKYDDITNLANVVLAIVHRLVMSCAIYKDTSPELLKDTALIVLQHVLFDDATLAAKRVPESSRRTERVPSTKSRRTR